MVHTTGEVISVSDRQGVATVLVQNNEDTYSKEIQEIPLARLGEANAQVLRRVCEDDRSIFNFVIILLEILKPLANF